MPAQAMGKVRNSKPPATKSWVDGKAMKLAQSFIVQLKKHDDRFVNLRVRTVAAESIILDKHGPNRIRKNEIMIRAQLREPCKHEKAEKAFSELIKDMDLAGYSSRFSPDEMFRPEMDTTDYILTFIRQETDEL